MRRTTVLAGLLALLNALPAHSGTQADYDALKAWCIGRNQWHDTGRKTPYQHPKEYFHYHHYCGAMRFMDKAYAARKQTDRKAAVVDVLNNLDYVISHVPKSHFLMPDVYAFKGRAELVGNKKKDAERDLLRALELDPKHVDAHVLLVDLYLDTNRKDRALEVLRSGLAAAPQNKALVRHAKKLGVDIPAPPPAETPPEPGPSVATAPSNIPSVPQESPRTDTQGTTKDTPNQEKDKPVTTKTSEAPPANTSVPGKPVGTAANPWCRFCPEAVPKAPEAAK